jgi:hypothetical protein
MKKLHSGKLHNFYSSPIIIREIKSRRMKWAEHVACKGERFWWESPKERNNLEDPGIDGRMESECILGRSSGRLWSGFSWLRIRTSGRLS